MAERSVVPHPELTQERLRSLPEYNHETGVLSWKVQRHRAQAGDVAGYLTRQGYIEIMIDGRTYGAHRLIWLYIHGTRPKGAIDHINQDKADNRLSNLRLATLAENNRNVGLLARNKSGLKGASLHRGKWRAKISFEGRDIFLGYFPTKEDAHRAYQDAARKLHGRFACVG